MPFGKIADGILSSLNMDFDLYLPIGCCSSVRFREMALTHNSEPQICAEYLGALLLPPEPAPKDQFGMASKSFERAPYFDIRGVAVRVKRVTFPKVGRQ